MCSDAVSAAHVPSDEATRGRGGAFEVRVKPWCACNGDADALRSLLRQMDCMDIFSFHGINTMQQLDWTLREGGCMEVVEEFRAQGKIRFVGFSTHGHASVIKAAISSEKFDCMNIHYHVSAGWILLHCSVKNDTTAILAERQVLLK